MDELVLYTASEVAEILRLNAQVVQRKLQAGEIPGYRIGKEWRVERGSLLAWLEEHSNQRSDEQRHVERFFDRDGRLRALPAARGRRDGVLRRLADEFEADRSYQEREVNEVLRRFHADVATLRRELVATKLLMRTTDGIYKRAGPRDPALRRA